MMKDISTKCFWEIYLLKLSGRLSSSHLNAKIIMCNNRWKKLCQAIPNWKIWNASCIITFENIEDSQPWLLPKKTRQSTWRPFHFSIAWYLFEPTVAEWRHMVTAACCVKNLYFSLWKNFLKFKMLWFFFKYTSSYFRIHYKNCAFLHFGSSWRVTLMTKCQKSTLFKGCGEKTVTTQLILGLAP